MEFTMNKRIIVRIVIMVVIVIVIAAAVLFIRQVISTPESIKIGVILSLTGSGEVTAEAAQRGMLLAAREINSRRGINDIPIELIFGDSKSKADEVQNVFDSIEEKYKPLLYLSVTSSISTAASVLAEKQKVLLIALVATAPQLTQGKEWTFRYFATADIQSPRAIAKLASLRVNNLGILYLDDEFGRGLSSLVDEGFEASGGLVTRIPFETGSDYSELISELIGTDAIYVIGFPTHTKAILQQLRVDDYQGYVLGSEGAQIPSVFTLPEAEGVYIFPPRVYDPNYLFSQELKEKFEAEYDTEFSYHAANGYDILHILAGLLEDEDRELSRDVVKNIFDKGFSYSGIFGSINLQPGQRDIVWPLYPAQIINGEVVYD